MAIKQRKSVSRREFEDALQELNVSVSEVAKGTEIPRAYLSDLRNRGVPLRREHDEKLRAYLEGQGVEFEEGRAPADDDGRATREAFPISSDIDAEVVERALDAIEQNDARLTILLNKKAGRESFLGMEGGYSGETKRDLVEIRGLLSENYVLFRKLCGMRALNGKPGAESLRDLVLADFRPRLLETGLSAGEQAKNDSEQETS